jgi:ABC-2 type transport system permease protein
VIAVNPSQKILVDEPKPQDEPAGEEANEESESAQDRRPRQKQDFDVLLAIMPSSLTEPQMANFLEYVKAGKPTLIFDDPCPFVFQNQSGLAMAPRLPKPGGGNQMFGGGPPPEQKRTAVKQRV